MKRCFDRYFADYEAKTSSMFIRLSRFFISTLMVLQRAGNEKVGPFLPPSLQPSLLGFAFKHRVSEWFPLASRT